MGALTLLTHLGRAFQGLFESLDRMTIACVHMSTIAFVSSGKEKATIADVCTQASG